VCFGERSWKVSNVGQSLDGWLKIYYLELRASEGTSIDWSRLHLQSLAPTNPHWARVEGYGPFSLWVIHKEGLYPSSGDSNRLMSIGVCLSANTIYQCIITYKLSYAEAMIIIILNHLSRCCSSIYDISSCPRTEPRLMTRLVNRASLTLIINRSHKP
jgi:hypothetical protein